MDEKEKSENRLSNIVTKQKEKGVMHLVVSGETIKSGVKNAIKAAYPDIDVHTGTETQTAQGYTYPCFFVKQQEVTWEPEMGNRSKRKYTMDIRYQHDENETSNEERLDEVGSELFAILRSIHLSDNLPIFSGEASYKILENQLRFTVSYQISTIQEKAPEVAMQTLDDSTHVREYKQERND